MIRAIQTDTLVKHFRKVDALQGLTLNVPEDFDFRSPLLELLRKQD